MELDLLESEGMFEKIKHTDEAGNEFWYARELQKVLKYTEWRNFKKVIEKAKKACENSKFNMLEHFVGINKVFSVANNAQMSIEDYKLTRYACYLIAQNGDSRKKIIAIAQTYFAVQTRKQEISISSDISEYKIKNIHNKYEVIKKVSQKLKDTYLSTENQSKIITNINTGMKIEVWKSGIAETFGNDKYYNNLENDLKKAKIASMSCLAKLIKYGKVRSKEAINYHNLNSKVRYAYLEMPIKIDNQKFDITIDIRRAPNGENKFYIHNLSIKNESDLSQSQCGWLSDKSLSK